MKSRLAVYAGTFDPPTNGHLWMIKQGASLFDILIVAIGVNPEKRCLFSVEDRLNMLRLSTGKYPNVEIRSFINLFLVRYAKSVNADFILRGIRNESDYGYERGMRNVNGDLDGDRVTTVFLMPPREIAEVSSSMVRGLVGPEGWESVVRSYVPEPVLTKLMEMHSAKSH